MNESAYTKSIGMVIGVPTHEKKGYDKDGKELQRNIVPFQWAIGLIQQSFPLSMSVQYIAINGKDVDIAREAIVNEAKKAKAKYLWFLDDDVQVPQNTSRELIYQLEQHEDVMACGGVYFSKRLPTEPVVFKDQSQGPFWKWKAGEVFEVDGIGTGCMMIKMEVFDKIEPPYFSVIDEAPETGPAFKKVVGEDLYFCQKVREAGYKILADGKVLCIHWDTEKGIPYMLPDDSYPMSGVDKDNISQS